MTQNHVSQLQTPNPLRSGSLVALMQWGMEAIIDGGAKNGLIGPGGL